MKVPPGPGQAAPAATKPQPLSFEVLGSWGGTGPGVGKFHAPEGIDHLEGKTFVVDKAGPDVELLAPGFAFVLGSVGDGLGELNAPLDVAAVGASDLSILDAGNHRVQRYTSGVWKAWGSLGPLAGQLLAPVALDVGPNGHVYVIDQGVHRVVELTADGDFVRWWGGLGSGEGQFLLPEGLATAPDGTVLVSDRGTSRITVFSAQGKYLRHWSVTTPGAAGASAPSRLDVGPDGKVYVTDVLTKVVSVYSASGSHLVTFGQGSLSAPTGIDVAPDGVVRVADAGPDRIVELRPVLAASKAPKVSGTKKVGKTLKASKGEWPVPGVTLSYRWLRDGKAIGGATKSSYKLKAKDAGRKISVRVTATRADYPAPSSASSAKVKIAKSKPQVTVKLAKTSVTWPAKAKVTARVKVKGVSRPTGKVRVLDGTKRLKTVTLKKSHRGRLTITVPRLKSGKHKIKLQYLGSSQVAKRTSKAKTLTVRR